VNPGLDPRRVATGVPLVNDRLLIELVNELHTADDLSRGRGRETFFGRLLGRATGRARRRDQAIDEAVIGAQRRTVDWVKSLNARLAVTDLVVAEVSDELTQVSKRLDTVESVLTWTADGLRELANVVAELATQTSQVLDDHERRLSALESKDAINEAIGRWRRPVPDPGLPWLVGAVLVAREVVAGPAGKHMFNFPEAGFGQLLTAKLLADPPQPWYQGVRPVRVLLADAVAALPSDEHKQMVADLLGDGISERFAIKAGPLTAALARAAALAGYDGTPPDEAARTALRDTLRSGDRFVFRSLSAEELVRQIVDEQFAEASRRRRQLDEGGRDDE
jgi:hypothetical protein